MATLQLFDKLLQFPLFQGMSRDDLSLVAGHTKFGFEKMPTRHVVIEEGGKADSLWFLLSGTIQIETQSADRTYRLTEQAEAPLMLQPESIFGYRQQFTHTYTTITDCNFLQLNKDEVMRLSESFLVFRLNLLNIFATQTQKQLAQPWRPCPHSLRQRVVRFMVDHSVLPNGPKTFYILMTQLAAEVGDSRLDVSRVLNQLQADGLLSLHRGRIDIPRLELLSAEASYINKVEER